MTKVRQVQLGDIARISSGGTPSRTQPSYWGGAIPWVKTTQIQNCLIREADVDEWITEEGLRNSSAKLYPSGTLLMAMYGQGKTRGQVGVLGLNATINQACAAIELDNKQADREFVFQQLLHKYDHIRTLSNVGGQDNLSAGLLREIDISLPPLPEQKAIADTLSTWDAAIEKTERLIAAKVKAFDALLDRLVHRNKNVDWKLVRLGEAFQERTESGREDLPLLSISRDAGVTSREDSNRKDTSSEDKSKYLRICPGDIGYNTMRMWQGVSALSSMEGIVSPAYTICIPNQSLIRGEFAAFLFKHPWVIHQFYRHSQGLTSDTWNLKFHHFSQIKVWLPSLEVQQQCVEQLNLANRELSLLREQNDALKLQKRGLMQKLLSGTWRVPVRHKVAS